MKLAILTGKYEGYWLSRGNGYKTITKRNGAMKMAKTIKVENLVGKGITATVVAGNRQYSGTLPVTFYL